MPPKNRTSVLMTLPPEFYSGHRDADQSLYWRSRRNSPLDLHRGQPAGARVPPRYSWHRGRRVAPGRPTRPASLPIRPPERVKGTGGEPQRQGRSVLRSVTGDLGFPRAEMSESIRDNPNRRLSHAGVAIGDFALDPRPSSRGRQAVRFGDGVALLDLGDGRRRQLLPANA